MKIHDLRPAEGSVKKKTRVGRGIAAGKGKTAGRGTKGQKSCAGGSIPAGFEGGQTPIHRRVPKLHGFRNIFRVEYGIVNVGSVSDYAEQGRFAEAEAAMAEAGLPVGGRKGAPLTVNAELLHAVGLIRTMRKPVKVLGSGDVTRPLFIVADAFTASARTKLEAAGGTAQVLEVPTESRPALGMEPIQVEPKAKAPKAAKAPKLAEAEAAPEPVAEAPAGAEKVAKPAKSAPKPEAKATAAKATAAPAKVDEPEKHAAKPAAKTAAKPAAKATTTTAAKATVKPTAKATAKTAPKAAAAAPATPAKRTRKPSTAEPAE